MSEGDRKYFGSGKWAQHNLLVDGNGNEISTSNRLPVEADLKVSDIQIGAVELKNATDDTRAVIGAGTAITEANNTLAVKDASIGLTTDADTALTVIGRLKKMLATFTDGTLKAITRGGAKGSTAAADVTSKSIDANTQALHVAQAEALPAGSNRIGKATIRNAADSADIDPVAESTFTARIGEVQASPTANTVLGRLKDLLTGIVLAAGANIIGKVGIDQTTDGTTNRVVSKISQTAGENTVDTELPAAVALADAAANPTTPTVGAALEGFNGVSWDRLRTANSAAGALTTGPLANAPHLWDAAGSWRTMATANAIGDGVSGQNSPGAALQGFNGSTWDRIRAANKLKNVARTAVAAGNSVTIWTPAAGKKVRVLQFSVTTSAATVLTLKLGATVLWERDFAGADGIDVLLPLNGGHLGAADETLTLASSNAATIGGSASGTEE